MVLCDDAIYNSDGDVWVLISLLRGTGDVLVTSFCMVMVTCKENTCTVVVVDDVLYTRILLWRWARDGDASIIRVIVR